MAERLRNLPESVALHNLWWWWSLKQLYDSHKKWYVMATAYTLCDPTRQWDPKSASDGTPKRAACATSATRAKTEIQRSKVCTLRRRSFLRVANRRRF